MPRAISLEQLHIAEPCHADWNTMAGDERTRFCMACDKHVHDLSARSRAESEALLAANPGSLCIQFARDKNGRVLTRDGLRRFRFVRRFGPILSMVVAVAAGLVGCRREPQVTTGQMALPGSVSPSTMPATSMATSQKLVGMVLGDIDPQIRGEVAIKPTTAPTDTANQPK